MKKLLILLIITLNLTAKNSCEDYNNYTVDNYVIELLMQYTSTILWIKSEDVEEIKCC